MQLVMLLSNHKALCPEEFPMLEKFSLALPLTVKKRVWIYMMHALLIMTFDVADPFVLYTFVFTCMKTHCDHMCK